MKNFIYETPTKVYFGKDEELKVGKIIAEFHPKKVLVHFGGNSARKSGLLDKVENCLREENISFVELGGVVANPELPLVREGIELGKKEGVDFVLAVGGGSVLDSSKAIAMDWRIRKWMSGIFIVVKLFHRRHFRRERS